MSNFDFDATEETSTGNVFGHLNTVEEIEADYASRETELNEELESEYINEEELEEALEALNGAMVERLLEITTSFVEDADMVDVG